jgi:hypothetical protein
VDVGKSEAASCYLCGEKDGCVCYASIEAIVMSVFTYQESSGGTRAADVRRQGVGSIGSAVTRRFFRNTPDFVKTPGSPLYTLVPAGTEAMAEGGIPCHNALTAYQPYSSLYPTAGGWTLTNGSGSAAYDTTVYMFDESIQPLGPRSIKLVGGAAAAPTALGPVSLNVATVTTLRLRVWARQEATSDLEWALYSSRVAKWWDPAAGTFSSAAAVWTDVGHTTGDTTDFYPHEFAIDKGATVSPDTLQVTYRQNANAKTGYLGYSGFDRFSQDIFGMPITSHLPSGPPFPQDAVAIAGSRAVPTIRLHSESGIVARDAGTLFLGLVPDFLPTCESGELPVLFLGSLDAALPPYLWLYYYPQSAAVKAFKITYDLGLGGGQVDKMLTAGWGEFDWPSDPIWRVAVAYEGAARNIGAPLQLRIYLQGGLVATETLAGELFGVALPKDAWINAMPVGFGSGAWSGTIRDLAFSPYIWTPAQIAARAAL